MKRILLLMWVLLLTISMQAQTTITVTSENTLASQLANLSTIQSSLIINGTLTAEDFEALNSNTYSQLASVTKLDLSEATVESISNMSGMNLSAMEYLRLPDGMTSADDVAEMKNLYSSSKNAALKMVGAYKDDTLDEVALYSFVSNSVQGFQTAMMSGVWSNIKVARLAGQYGVNDLDKGTSDLVFSSKPAEWDFTGANFDACTVNGNFPFANNSEYYSETDPFEEGTDGGKPAPLTGLSNFQTNAFYYFKGYAGSVVKLKLPDQITELPPFCLQMLGKGNKDNYKTYYGLDDNGFNAVSDDGESVAIDHLVIPNSIVTVGYECAYNTKINKVSFGSGLKVVQGGAFKQVSQLQDIEFATGISNCYLGDEAFQLCYDVKHIVLCEGIVSIGAGCFQNSQQMESIRLPQSLQYIGNDAFNLCLALGSITIPPNVKKIGKRAFKLTALRDIYLTTTDPDGVPEIFTVGTSFAQNTYDSQATFSLNQMEGFNTVPYNNTTPYSAGLNSMTWDEAVSWYYINVNCMTVLHFPDELADRVRARISGTYGTQSTDGIGLPIRDGDGNYQTDDLYDDVVKRATGYAPELDNDNPYPAADLGSEGQGKFSKDGWAQFLLMKGYVPEGESTVYTKKYKDVWYTMCFPFELTDEQLAATFNEGFNIVDFSGVEIKDPDTTPTVENKTLVLHFNKVAETLYKDPEKNLYERKKDGSGNIIREQDGSGTYVFDYNVYIRNGQEYHHVIVAKGEAAITKTKTFAPGNSLEEAAQHKDQAVVIDGFLASAGHPYMVHPNTGTVPTAQPVDCYFSGITWVVGDDEGVANGDLNAKSTDQVREELYEAEKRTVDLGVEKKTNNFDQEAYDGYTGQTYTFIGNHREYKAGIDLSGKPVEPTPPSVPKEPTVVAEPSAVEDPGITLTENDVTLYDKLTNGNGEHNRGPWYGLNEITANWNDNDSQVSVYKNTFWIYGSALTAISSDYATNNNPNEAGFNYCKNLFNNYGKVAAYQQYLIDKAKYDQYLIDKAQYEQDLANYPAAQTAYQTALQNYPDELAAWKATMASQGAFVVIPKDAYFLGTKKNDTYPKFWLETSNNPNRSTGLWSQYAAIIIPNTEAVNGLEKELGPPINGSGSSSTNNAKGYPIAFDEDYDVFNQTPQGIATLIEKIEKEEGKTPEVEYMDIVVSIDGKIVSRDKTTFEGLPKGVYIINGKKYYVK